MKNKKRKWLHTFNYTKDVEVETEESVKGEDGKETIKIKKENVEKQYTVGLKSPNRRQYDEAELFNGVEISKGIKSGMLTVSLLRKRYVDDGGFMSEEEKGEYALIYIDLQNKENELQSLRLNFKDLKDQEKKDKITQVTLEIAELRRKLFEFETQRNEIFEQTAEARARNKTILWWVLHLSHIREGEGEWVPLFNGGNYEERLESYDEIVERDEDEKLDEAVQKLAYFTSFWYNGQIKSSKDFEQISELIDININADKTSEEAEKNQDEFIDKIIKEKIDELEDEDELGIDVKEDSEKTSEVKKEKPKAKRGRKPKANPPADEKE
tara:strand:+ start:626 stop:1603 length:978 start_codon:yes stop_codon:yes gene_type:complete